MYSIIVCVCIKRNDRMERNEGFLKKEYRKNLAPIMLSVLGGTINSLIDGIFVSRAMGADALAAVNLSMPVYLFICVLGALVSFGAAALAAGEIAKGKVNKAQKCFKCGLLLCIIVSVIIAVPGVMLCKNIANALANGGSLSGEVYKYCVVLFAGALPTILMYLFVAFLQIDGKLRAISIMIFINVAADIVFDVFFIVIIDMGLYGAVTASIVASTLSCIFGCMALLSDVTNFRLGLSVPDKKTLKGILRLGSTPALGNLFDAMKLVSINSIVLVELGERQAAVWAAINVLSEISMIIILGVPRAAFAMLRAYYISKENSGVRIMMRLQAVDGAALCAIFGAVIIFFSSPVGALFDIDESMLFPCVCIALYTLFMTLGSIMEQFFNCSGRVGISNVLSGLDRFFLPAAAALVMSGYGTRMWLFMPVSALLSFPAILLLTYPPYWNAKNTDRPLSRLLLLDDKLERENKIIDFSIKGDDESVCSACEQIQDFCTANDMTAGQTMKLGLAMEELITVMTGKLGKEDDIDLRAFAHAGMFGLRIRMSGKRYDPFSDSDEEGDSLMGVEMIKKMSEVCEHNYTFGMNIVNIVFQMEDQ